MSLLATAVVGALVHCWYFSDFTVDDGAISFCYARNLAHGHGLVLFPGAEHVEGYTNFLWVVLLALGVRVGIDVVVWSHLLGAVLAACSVVGCAELVAALRGKRSPWDAAPALLVASLLPIPYWAESGLEGGLYTAAVIGCAARLVIEHRDPQLRPPSALFAAAAALTRPDGLSVLCVACAIRVVGIVGAWQPRLILRWFAWALLPVGLHFAWRFWYYGYALPNTFYAKVEEPFVLLHPAGLGYVRGFVERFRLLPLVAVTLLSVVPGKLFFVRAGLFGMLVSLFAFPVYARGDWMSEGRFLVATLPLLAALAATALARGIDLIPRPKLRVAAATLITLGLGAFIVPHSLELSRARRHVYPVPMSVVGERGRWYRNTADQFAVRNPSALDGDLGGSTYYSDMAMVDLGGLADVTLSRSKLDPTIFREYLYNERRPTFLHLVGFWINDGPKNVPEFADRYVPGQGIGGMFIDRQVFLEPEMDTRVPLLRLGSVDVLRADVGREVQLWLLVRALPQAVMLKGASQQLAVDQPSFPRTAWRPGEIVRLTVRRPSGALQICEGQVCLPLAEGAAGAVVPAWPQPSPSLLTQVEARGELEVTARLRQRLQLPLVSVAGRFYDRALAAMNAGDATRAFADFTSALRLDPDRAWARRYIEALRLQSRRPYRYIYESKLDAALRTLHLTPTAENMVVVAQLALAADQPERASLAWRAMSLLPTDDSGRLAVAECLGRAGHTEEAAAILPATLSDDRARAVAGWIRQLLSPLPAATTGRPVAPGLVLVSSWAALEADGRVALSLALRKTTEPVAVTLAVAGKAVPFDRSQSVWAPDEIVVHTVRLRLVAGTQRVAVGNLQLGVVVTPFTHDFESGALDGWQASGGFVGGVRHWRRGLPMRATEGQWMAQCGSNPVGELRSPPLGEVDEVCFVVAGGRNTGVRIEAEGATVSLVTGQDDENPRPTCLGARASAQIVAYDQGHRPQDFVHVDDFACFLRGTPVACAGSAHVEN